MAMTPDKPTLLLVDDEATNLKLLREILCHDYNLSFARNGREMLHHALLEPDLILLDVMMPDMDGYQACLRLKENPATRDIPVIFVTACCQVADEVHGFEVGAVDYITKPVQSPIVLARVKTHLALRQAREVIARQSREIRKQNEALQEAARLRDDVEQIVRHDLKGPLNAIVGIPGLLMEELVLNEDQKEYLRTIEESGYRLLNMINLSHDLYKMERGLYTLHPRPLDILRTIQVVIKEFRDFIHGKELSVVITLDGKVLTATDIFLVSGEKLLYHSMLSNLLKNALEASPEGETVTVAFERGERPVMRIRNRGSVPLEIREHFFEKFVTAGKCQGTGLGTYSARLIATTSGNEIQLDTSLEGETSIVVRF
ncbi:MAG: hybrid sensor histidine kinase/response regulator [Magnetococcales bacterium]|nr:hybrid sensor histidine kinase/response regulator [Magnetococcales bacterium]